MDGLHADIPKVISTCPRQSEEDFVKFNKRLECYAKKVGEICEKKVSFFLLNKFLHHWNASLFARKKNYKKHWMFSVYKQKFCWYLVAYIKLIKSLMIVEKHFFHTSISLGCFVYIFFINLFSLKIHFRLNKWYRFCGKR